MLKFRIFIKDFLLGFPITYIFKPLSSLFLFLHYNNKLIKYIYKHKSSLEYNDFYKFFRNYNDRYPMYEFLVKKYNLYTDAFCFFEFGVAGGDSIKWWADKSSNAETKLFGFDTFEGLPESWGLFKQGHFAQDAPIMADTRITLTKGLFQDTLQNFIDKNQAALQSKHKKIFHLDADLYTATLYTLTTLHQYFKKGDIIMFDEFSVAVDEFRAFDEYTSSFYVTLKPISASVNFNKVAFEVQ